MKYIENPKFKLRWYNSLEKNFEVCAICVCKNTKVKWHFHISKRCLLIDKVSECEFCKEDICLGSIGFIWYNHWDFSNSGD